MPKHMYILINYKILIIIRAEILEVRMVNLKISKGFTLAEVLITLGIIGVVAAITIPNLITEHQKRTTVTKLQKAISVINQAYRLSYEENGDVTAEEAKVLGAEPYFKKYWEPYIKVLTLCKTPEMCGYKSQLPFYNITGTSNGSYFIHPGRVNFLTMDGFLYVVAVSGGVDNNSMSSVWVDINGGTGPNKFGRDIFVLDRIPDGKGVQPYGYNFDSNNLSRYCSYTSTNACAEKIKRAGWKIDKSYPWK